jgi:hypothetical protein
VRPGRERPDRGWWEEAGVVEVENVNVVNVVEFEFGWPTWPWSRRKTVVRGAEWPLYLPLKVLSMARD